MEWTGGGQTTSGPLPPRNLASSFSLSIHVPSTGSFCLLKNPYTHAHTFRLLGEPLAFRDAAPRARGGAAVKVYTPCPLFPSIHFFLSFHLLFAKIASFALAIALRLSPADRPRFLVPSML